MHLGAHNVNKAALALASGARYRQSMSESEEHELK